MRYIKQASTALLGGVVLFFTSCSDNHGHKVDTDNHFEYDSTVQQTIKTNSNEKQTKVSPLPPHAKQEDNAQEISSLNEQITTSASALLAANKLIADESAKISTLQQQRDEAIQTTLKMKEELQALNASITTLEEEKKEALASLKDLSDKNSALQTKIQESETLLEKIKDEDASSLDETKKVCDEEIEKANSQLEGLKDQLTEKESKISELEASLEEANSQTVGIKTKLAASAAALLAAQQLTANKDDNLSDIMQERDDAINVALQMKTDMQEKEKKIEEIETELDSYKNQLSDKEEALAKLEEVKENLAQKENEFKELEESYKSKISELEASLEEANSQTVGIKTKLAASAAALLAVQQLTQNKDDNLSTILQERDEAIQVALEMKKKIQEKDAQFQDLNQSFVTLKGDLEETKAKVVEQNSTVATALESKNSELEQKNKELEETKTQLADKQAQLEELNQKVEQLTQDVERLTVASQEQNSTAASTIESAQKELEAKTTEMEKLKNTIDDLTKEKEDSRGKIAEKIAALVQAEKFISTKNDEINNLNKQLKEKDEMCKQTEEQLNKKLVIGEILNTFKLSKVEFETGSAVLTKKSTHLLDTVAQIMKEHTEYKYKIQGHTDSKGDEQHNIKLSNERAKSVQTYLISKGVDAQLLSHEGFGSSKPIADNATQKGRLANRRVVFEISN